MKKALLTVCVLLSMQGRAQLAPALIDEDEFHPGATWEGHRFIVTHTNAHSHGNLLINNVNSDLYVFTWDYGNEPLYPGEAGMAVRQYLAGTPVEMGTTPLFEDYFTQTLGGFPSGGELSSLEAGILREGLNTYIVLSYCRAFYSGGTVTGRDVFVDLYEWTAAGNLNLISSDNISQQGNMPFDWVHLDVNNLTDVVVTWGDHGKIHTVGGTLAGGGLQFSGVGVLDEGTINSHVLGRPDVAMMRDDNGEIHLYYVMTRGDALFVTKGLYNDLMAIPPGSVDPLPVELLDHQGIAGEFIYDVPRIDAPDNALYPGHEAWSYVVTENYSNLDLVFTGSYSETGGLIHGYLNDGAITCGGACDISSDAAMDPDIYNLRAVVAYSDNGTDRFYAWCFRNPGWLAGIPFPGEATYISVKTDEDLNLLHTGIALNQYCRIPESELNTNYSQSIGLSTQNDASPELFTAFIQWPYNPLTYEYYFGLKTVDWSTTAGFRPAAPVAITDREAKENLQVYPNPFSAGFKIELDEARKAQIHTLKIYDVLGREVYNDQGTLEGINTNLKIVGEALLSGAYFLELRDEDGAFKYRQKLVKH